MTKHFSAPWDTKLKLITGGILLLCAVIYFAASGLAAAVLLAVILLSAAFAVRGYSIHEGKLLIHRLGWAKTFDLAKLSSAEMQPGVMLGSVRTWGIGGLFGYVGHFRNGVLGAYRAYATNSTNAVVLDFGDQHVVVTPEGPAEFVEAIRAQRPAS